MIYLTRREKEVLDYIREFNIKHGFAPSLNEIRSGLGLSSVSTIHEHITKLTAKGYLARHPNKARSFQIKQPGEGFELPISTLQGIVDSTKQTNMGKIDLTTVIQAENGSVAAIAQGNYLAPLGVFDGDYIIVIPGNGLMDGDIMIGLIDGYKPVFGRLYHFGSKVIIKPLSGDKDSLVVEQEHLVIAGRVKAIIRKY